MLKPRSYLFKKWAAVIVSVAFFQPAFGQTAPIELNDLSAFKNPPKSWQMAGDIQADLEKANKVEISKGTGILVNLHSKKNPGKDLFTEFEHGDVDLELDYMMAKGSNSGIYLQGMYELQLEDSWTVKNATSANNGGIYERWDESLPKGQKGFQGYAPRQNVSRAPGLWQHLKITYQAPRFNEAGKKIENAKFLRVELNGVLIHENVELSGPTRGAISEEEKAKGPLRFQGDHGTVAFRNIRLTRYEKPRPELLDLKYTVYEGEFDGQPDFNNLPPEAEGTSVVLTSDLSPKSKKYLIRYTGILRVKEAGNYSFDLQVPGGAGFIKINDKEVVSRKENSGSGTIELPKGDMPFELLYSKYVDWVEPGLGLKVSGAGIRDYLISDSNVMAGNAVDPILVDPTETPLLRSFMDIPDAPRITNAVSVSSPSQLHYTFDMGKGSLVQLWRGGFLDTTPMWHGRGDGSSRPLGSVQLLVKNQPQLTVARLSSDKAAWPADTSGSSFRPKGYVLDEQGQPAFSYQAYGTAVKDEIRVLDGGKGLKRELKLQKPVANLYARLAAGSTIQEIEKGLYIVDGKAYYLRIEDAGGAKPVVRKVEGGQELILPLGEKVSYSILF